MTAETPTTPDLRELIDIEGPFATALIPARSDVFGAAERLIVQAKNALREAPDGWDSDVDEVKHEIAALSHGEGAALIVIRPLGGPTFFEFIDDAVHHASLAVGDLPRLSALIEARQSTVAHVVVETDLTGATISAFDDGHVQSVEQVEGETEFVHRGHPGGWSQRRFQQRAENTWEENAKDVADTVRSIAADVAARVVFVAGPTRASSMLTGHLDGLTCDVIEVDAGDSDGIAAEVMRHVAGLVAAETTQLIDEARDRPDRLATSARHVESSLADGRVRTLLVHDDTMDDDTSDEQTDASRVIDRCIAMALRTDADVRIVPRIDLLDQGVAATLRW